MKRLAVATVIVLGLGMAPAAGSVAADAPVVTKAVENSLQSDFNKDGYADLAIGVPSEDVGAVVDAGAVNVLYGRPTGLTGDRSQYFTQNTPGVRSIAEPNDRFGGNLTAGDFNKDGFGDLAIGVSREAVGSIRRAGAVHVLYGRITGLTGARSQYFTQNTARVLSIAEANDQFGANLTAGDFDSDGFTDLAIGVPAENVGHYYDAGAVNVLYGGTSGLTGAGSQYLNQNTPGVGGPPGGRFGTALVAGDFDDDGYADLAIGAPDAATGIGLHGEAGVVNVLYGGAAGLTGSGSRLFNQDTPGVRDSVETLDAFGLGLAAGDFDNDGAVDLAVGAVGESIGDIFSAGAIHVLYGGGDGLTGAGSQYFTQNSPGVSSSAEEHENFGGPMAAGDFDDDGYADLAIGVPIESIGTTGSAGAVTVLYGGAAGLTGAGSQYFNQNTPGVATVAEAGDLFGVAVIAVDFDHDHFADLAVGVPGESGTALNAVGAVNIIFGNGRGLTGAGSQFFTQNSPGVWDAHEEGDQFGYELAAAGR